MDLWRLGFFRLSLRAHLAFGELGPHRGIPKGSSQVLTYSMGMCPLCLARARVPTNSRQLTPSYPMQVGTGRSDLEAFEDTLTDAHRPKVRYHYSLGSHKSHMRMGGKSSKRSLRTIFPTTNVHSARDQPAIRFGFPAVALPWS